MFEERRARKNVVVALLGRTPQVLTETLYALAVEQGLALEELWVLSTAEGLAAAQEKLLHPQTGRFAALQRDYPAQCGGIRFSAEQILVAQDGLLPLADISNRRESESFLELILRVLWELTSAPDCAVHCSLAGGRKTMSTYAALVMQMLGRPQDRLYHVLLTPSEAERHPEFFYPTPVSRQLALKSGKNFDSAAVKVELVEIPFVRLREHLPLEVFQQRTTFAELLQWTQTQIAALPRTPVLQLFPREQLVRVAGREVKLPPIEFCFYWHFAERSQKRPEEVAREKYEAYFERPEGDFFLDSGLEDVLGKYRGVSKSEGMVLRFEEALGRHRRMDFKRVLQYVSKVNRKLGLAFADLEMLDLYRISAVGRYGKCYGLKLDGRLIRVEE